MTQEVGTSALIDSWAENGGLTEPDQTKKESGWLAGERPAFQHMNWLQNLFSKKINHVLANGVPLHNTTTPYPVNAITNKDGVLYVANTLNTGSTPPSANWDTLINAQVQNLVASVDPVATNDNTEGYEVFSRWVNDVSGDAFILIDASTGAADWQNTTLTVDDLGSAAFANTGDFATAAQGAKADTAVQPGDLPAAIPALLTVVASGYVDTVGGALTVHAIEGATAVRTSTGLVTVTLTTAMAGTNYVVIPAYNNGSISSHASGICGAVIISATQFSIKGENTGGSSREGAFWFTVLGAQV